MEYITSLIEGRLAGPLAFVCFSAICLFNNQVVKGETLEHIAILYDFAYDSYLKEETGKSDFKEILNRIFVEISKHPDQDKALYWKGKTLYLNGISEIGFGDEKKGEFYLKEAVRAASTLRSALPEQSYCLEAEARAQIMLIKGIPYIITNGGKVQKLAELALEINPDNAIAKLIVARSKINVPGLFGGAPKKGIEMLEEVLDQADGNPVLSSHERFRYFLALGRGYEKIKEKEKARTAYENARVLYPGNGTIVEILNNL
jgi:hypothetical protein